MRGRERGSTVHIHVHTHAHLGSVCTCIHVYLYVCVHVFVYLYDLRLVTGTYGEYFEQTTARPQQLLVRVESHDTYQIDWTTTGQDYQLREHYKDKECTYMLSSRYKTQLTLYMYNYTVRGVLFFLYSYFIFYMLCSALCT